LQRGGVVNGKEKEKGSQEDCQEESQEEEEEVGQTTH
jgi:hypothetical protein